MEAHCTGTVCSISSSGLDEMNDCTVDLLLPPSVKWKCWRLADCTEYDPDSVSAAHASGDNGEGGAGGESD